MAIPDWEAIETAYRGGVLSPRNQNSKSYPRKMSASKSFMKLDLTDS